MNFKITRKQLLLNCFAAGSLLISSGMQAQDFHLTQYDAAPQNLNPSMTGLFEGYFRVHAHYRTQWHALATNPFQTMEIAYDMPLKNNISIGGQIMDYTAGAGNYNVFSFEGSAAYDKGLDKKDRHHISVGLQLGVIQKSIDLSKLVWGNQYTYSNGGMFDNTMSSGEAFNDRQSVILPDVTAGLTYYYANQDARINPFIGFSAAHLTRPKETFFSSDNQLPIKYIIHGGCRVSINETIQLLPKFFFMNQVNDQETTMSLFLNYYLRQADAFIILGPTFRLSGPLSKKKTYEVKEKDAAAIELGLKYGRYTYRVSYDINTSSLNPYSNGKGGLELSVTYIGRKQKPNPVINCPHL